MNADDFICGLQVESSHSMIGPYQFLSLQMLQRNILGLTLTDQGYVGIFCNILSFRTTSTQFKTVPIAGQALEISLAETRVEHTKNVTTAYCTADSQLVACLTL